MNQLDIVVNGEARRVPGPSTVADLLRHLNLDPQTVVVELNHRIVRRPHLHEITLAPGDSVELVHFVGGG